MGPKKRLAGDAGMAPVADGPAGDDESKGGKIFEFHRRTDGRVAREDTNGSGIVRKVRRTAFGEFNAKCMMLRVRLRPRSTALGEHACDAASPPPVNAA